MIRTPPRSTRNDTLSPYTTPCRSHQRWRLLRLLLGPPRAAPRARPLLPPRRRQLRALRPRGDAAVPLHQALAAPHRARPGKQRSEEHTSELQSLMRISYAVFCLKKHNTSNHTSTINTLTIHI